MSSFDSDRKIKDFFEQYPQRKYSKGEIIFSPNSQIDKVYYIKDGCVREYTDTAKGNEITLHLFMPGSYFPMTDVISHIPNRFYCEALIPSTIHFAPKRVLLQMLLDNPAILLELTDRILRGLNKLLMRIESLSFDDAYHKTILALLFLVTHFGSEERGEATIPIHFSHQEIATIASVSRETATREIDKLLSKKLIMYKNKKFVILDLKKLKQELQ